ncbi:MAG: pyrrolidone-carboxylate peptidase [Alphaproteobacteria bacterium]
MRPILATGFTPFAGLDDNPSAIVVADLATGVPGAAVETLLLDVVWATAAGALTAAIDRLRPAAVVCFGLARGRDAVNLERFAVNVDDSPTADNAGALRRGLPIRPDGPAAYGSTLPLEALGRALDGEGLAWRFSNHAGAFLCNHVFYAVRHHLAATAPTVPAGFVHLPPLPPEAGAMAAADQCRAARCIVGALAREIGAADAGHRLAG